MAARSPGPGIGWEPAAGFARRYLRRTRPLRGVLIRDWRHRGLARRITRIQTLRFAYLADRHAEVDVLALATKNYAGRVVLQEMIDGRTWDRGDVSLLTPVLAGEGMLALQTLGSGIMLALAFACRMQGAEDVALRRTVEEG